jgi:hypothetical protein
VRYQRAYWALLTERFGNLAAVAREEFAEPIPRAGWRAYRHGPGVFWARIQRQKDLAEALQGKPSTDEGKRP